MANAIKKIGINKSSIIIEEKKGAISPTLSHKIPPMMGPDRKSVV